MPTIVFEVRDAAGNDLSAVAVTMDGYPLVERLEGTALSIDPGEHEFVFHSKEMEPVTEQWVIREGEKGRREKVILGSEVVAPTRVAETETPKPTAGRRPTSSTDSQTSRSTLRTVGAITGGVGLVALGIGAAEQITAKSRDSHSQRAARSDDVQVQETVHALHEQAVHAQTYALVFGAVGSVAVATGLYLLLSNLDGDDNIAEALRIGVVPSTKHPRAEVSWVGSF
jgi:hypothetical protein